MYWQNAQPFSAFSQITSQASFILSKGMISLSSGVSRSIRSAPRTAAALPREIA